MKGNETKINEYGSERAENMNTNERQPTTQLST
jgi:hypothetical protein